LQRIEPSVDVWDLVARLAPVMLTAGVLILHVITSLSLGPAPLSWIAMVAMSVLLPRRGFGGWRHPIPGRIRQWLAVRSSSILSTAGCGRGTQPRASWTVVSRPRPLALARPDTRLWTSACAWIRVVLSWALTLGRGRARWRPGGRARWRLSGRARIVGVWRRVRPLWRLGPWPLSLSGAAQWDVQDSGGEGVAVAVRRYEQSGRWATNDNQQHSSWDLASRLERLISIKSTADEPSVLDLDTAQRRDLVPTPLKSCRHKVRVLNTQSVGGNVLSRAPRHNSLLLHAR